MGIASEQKTNAVVRTKAKIYAGLSVFLVFAGALFSCRMKMPYLIYISWLLWFGACLCGIISLWKMKNIKGFVLSRLLAWTGCILSVFLTLSATSVTSDVLEGGRDSCIMNLQILSKSIKTYGEKHDGEFPDPSKWCDLLLSEPNNKSNDIFSISEKTFKCDVISKGKSGYAFNKNLAGKRISEVDPNVVVIFETTAVGWNQNGGPEIICTDRHKGILASGSFVLCPGKDDVRRVYRSGIKNLRWNP